MITRDVLVNQLLDDRRDGMNFSAICPEVLLKKLSNPILWINSLMKRSPESDDKFPPLKSKENLVLN